MFLVLFARARKMFRAIFARSRKMWVRFGGLLYFHENSGHMLRGDKQMLVPRLIFYDGILEN